MKSKNDTVLHNHLTKMHAKVDICAYSESAPGINVNNPESDYYRMVYVLKGTAQLIFKDERYPLMPGRLYFLPLRLIQSYSVMGEEAYVRYWCNFQVGHDELHFVDSLKLPLYIEVRNGALLLELFTKLAALQNSPSLTRELRQKAVLLELFAYYLDESNAKQAESDKADLELKWNEILMYIERYLHTNISVDELAKVAYLHPNYFITAFKSRMGCSPIQYVTNRRIATAKQLLSNSALPVAEIANRVGLQNHYLSRLFKRYTGVTPVHYRRTTRNTDKIIN